MISNITNTSLEMRSGLRIDRGIETRQLCSRQDHVAHGYYSSTPENHTYWLAVFDGHGKDQVPNQIRNANLQEIMKGPTPWLDLQTIIQADKVNTHIKNCSGSTMIYAKVNIAPTHIDLVINNIGDSTGVVFLNDEPIFVTTPQDYENGAEMARIIKENRVDVKNPFLLKGQNFDLISPTTLRSVEGKYVVFNGPHGRPELSMTQCLGHNGITGLKPDTTVFRFNRTDKIRVCLCSDGVSDVMPVNGLVSSSTFPFMTSTTKLLDEAERRWKQEWKVQSGSNWTNTYSTSFPTNGYDDCCCAMISIQPIIVPIGCELPLSVFRPCIVEEVAPPKTINKESEPVEEDIYA